jgi:hypothetical protein
VKRLIIVITDGKSTEPAAAAARELVDDAQIDIFAIALERNAFNVRNITNNNSAIDLGRRERTTRINRKRFGPRVSRKAANVYQWQEFTIL